MYIYTIDSFENYVMIQSGSGNFEYSIDDEIVLSGKISYASGDDLNTKSERSITLDKSSDDFQECVLKDEIYAILEKNGINLGDNFKNMIDFSIYKNCIQGYVTWKNDWIYFLDGLLRIPLLENLGACQIEVPVSIRRINIIPVMFEKINETGTIVFSFS